MAVPSPDEAIAVSTTALVRLNEAAASLSLHTATVRARMSGEYLSPFKGRGMEFDESRPYQPGDDVRNLDWRVMARTGRAHTKLFREERERPVFLWVDLRPAMFFATRGAFKSVVAARAAVLLAWAANRQGDRVGGIIFSDQHHDELKPGRGKAAVLHLINRVAHHPAWSGEKRAGVGEVAEQAMLRLRRVVRPGSMVFLLSDFRGLDFFHHARGFTDYFFVAEG